MKKVTLNALLESINGDPTVNSLIQSSPVCHKVFDPNYKLKFMSNSGVSALKIENIEDFYDQIFPTDVAPKETRDIVNKYMRLASKGETNTIEYHFFVDGVLIWYRTTISPFFDADGKLIYITADSMDITSKKKIEETNRTLLETSPICLKEISKNDEGYTLTFMSSSGQEQLGITNVEELYGQSYPLDSYPNEAKKLLTEALDKVVKTGESAQVECELVDHHGKALWYLSTFTVQRRNENGEIVSITGASQDVTEKVINQIALAKSKEEAERANRAKSQFLSRMSHELRTPLNAILGFGQVMKKEPNLNAEEQESSLDFILDAGYHLLNLVDEVLDLSRIENGKFSINLEHLNANSKVKNLISQIQPIAEEKNIKILNCLSQKEDLFIKADKKAFKQIILNLLNNAVKYNHEAGSITVNGGKSGDDKIWISVSDTGPGIAKENIEKLFEPFNRLGQEFGKTKGTGIGLSISKMLVELLSGSISVECEPGNGCSFTITLPAGNRELENINTSTPNLENSKIDIQSKNQKILYIEDNNDNLVLVQRILKSNPKIEFLSAMKPREGIELAKTKRPDLILMDIQLPEMDGRAVFKELQKLKETRDIPVIALTAEAMKDSIKAGLDFGFKDYITKPLDIEVFLEKVNKVLN